MYKYFFISSQAYLLFCIADIYHIRHNLWLEQTKPAELFKYSINK